MREIFALATSLVLGCGRVDFDAHGDGGVAPGCIAQLSAYGDMVCVLRTDASVWCWGSNSEGQLGDGSLVSRKLPGPSLVTDAIEIATGEDTGCAVLGDRSLVCWGEGSAGQLGDGGGVDRAVPTAVPLPAGVTQVRVSETHACARLDDGTGRCWGDNQFGALGKTPPPSTELSPISAPVGGVAAVTLGDYFSCVLRADASAACFGRNLAGELGDGTTLSRSNPVAVAIPEPIVQIAAGCDHHACAVTELGSVYCWGDNTYGQIGTGATTPREPMPVRVVGVSDVVQVSVGAFHSCARTRDGEIWCWGVNDRGQLGDGSLADRSLPVRVTSFVGTPADLQTTCAGSYVVLADRTLVAWGAATLLGTSESVDQVAPIEVPIPCPP